MYIEAEPDFFLTATAVEAQLTSLLKLSNPMAFSPRRPVAHATLLLR